MGTALALLLSQCVSTLPVESPPPFTPIAPSSTSEASHSSTASPSIDTTPAPRIPPSTRVRSSDTGTCVITSPPPVSPPVAALTNTSPVYSQNSAGATSSASADPFPSHPATSGATNGKGRMVMVLSLALVWGVLTSL
ncbi:hypothetical protein DFH09DRAFT_1153017 [Mycena vulgaris]|nr:hypothetical protein DFH09DRAFT_1153017 [Mycena vulgaris]